MYHQDSKMKTVQRQSSRLPFVVLTLFLLVIELCTAQRAAVSLGSKLMRKIRKDKSTVSEGALVAEEATGEWWSSSSWSSWLPWTESWLQWNDARLWGIILVLVQGVVVLLNNNNGTVIYDEEIVVDDLKVDQGFLNRVEIGFENVTMRLEQSGKPDRLILDGIRGKASPGRMLAIMGPSGSGKSTLVHALAGLLKESNKVVLSGMRYINGEPISGDSQIPAAFIEQEVNFFPHMTVKETLEFRVELKLGKELGKSARDEVVTDLMDSLGLTKSAGTIVGNSKIRGISGGERKRLSIACEMISSPPVIFLDEPTSGLDSYQATQVVETIRKLSDRGKTIISVIHQPSQHTFAMFDDLLLLSEGKQMYFGEVNAVRTYLESLGYKAIKEMGTAEHVLDCISRVNGGIDSERESEERIQRLADESRSRTMELAVCPSPEEIKGRAMKHISTQAHRRPPANFFRQFKLLLGRALSEAVRAKGAIIIKLVQQVTLGVIYGGIYHLGNNQASIMDRFGLLSLIAIGATNMATASTIRSFPREKAVVSGEMSSKLYSTLPYFLAKAISEIPLIGVFNAIFSSIIYPLTRLQKGKFKMFMLLTTLHSIASEGAGLFISAVSPTSDFALALFPPVIVLNIIFDGKNISEENTPRLLRWIPKLGLIRWGFEGMAINEFDGLTFDTSGPRRGPVAKNGEEALDRFNLVGKTVNQVIRAQINIIGACWLLSYLGLSLTRQKFEYMRTPEK